MIAVYENINQTKKAGHKIYSVMCMTTKRVLKHVSTITLINVTFKVSESSRQRVIKTGHKNVHAYAIGIESTETTGQFIRQVCYNPRVSGYFFTSDEPATVINAVGTLVLNHRGAFQCR